MSPLQQKAIQRAIELLEEMQNHPFSPENYPTQEQLRTAAKAQHDAVFADGGKRAEAISWLRAALTPNT